MSWSCKRCGWKNESESKKCLSCGKRKKKKREPLPRLDAPVQCILLSLDTANVTGWAIRVCGLIESHGQHKLYTDDGMKSTDAVLDKLQQLRSATGLPIAVVSERSWGGYMGQGATMGFGYWVRALRSINVPMKRFHEVYPASWRAVILPGFHDAERSIVRAEEQRKACEMVGALKLGGDEAPAILIGEWGAYAGEIAQRL